MNKATKTMKRNWKQATAFSVVFFIMCTFLPILGGCSSKSSQQDTKVQQTEQAPSTAALHEGKISDLKALLAKADSIPPAELRSGLVTAKQDLASLNSKMEGEFANTSEMLTRLNLPEKMKIQEDVVAKFQSSKDRLNTALDETVASSDADINARSASLYGLVNELCPEEQSQGLGAELPNQLVERDPVAPVLGANIAPAYMHGAPGLTPSDLPVDPTPADLAPTIDAQHSQEIIDKAAELENDPVKIYEWVRNNIDFEPYYGSKKGATETLAEMAGNDMDTASLLISLYRVSGIPARYITGVIEITADQAMAWTATEVPEAALRLFASGGTPVTGIQEGGQITRFQLTHTYTEAYLNYSNYRGAAGGEGPKEWIPLDASYKEYEETEPVNLQGIGYDFETFINQLNADSDITADGSCVTNIPKDPIINCFQQVGSLVQERVESEGRQDDIFSLIDRESIINSKLGLLPSALDFKCINCNEEWSSLPSQDRYTVSIELAGSSTSVSIPDLGEKQITIDFASPSEEESSLIREYQTISDAPAYLIDLLPVISIEHQDVLVGEPSKIGKPILLNVEMCSPTFSKHIQHTIYTGCTYSIILDTGDLNRSKLEYNWSRLEQALSVIEDWNNNPSSTQLLNTSDYIGEMHNLLGILYFQEANSYSKLISALSSIRYQGQLNEALVGTAENIKNIYGVPVHLNLQGQFIDVECIEKTLISRDDSKEKEIDCFIKTGFACSFLESDVFRSFYNLDSGLSSVSLLDYAISNGIGVYSINTDNLDSVLPSLMISEEDKEAISSSVLAGGNVLVPETYINIGTTWQGLFWIVLDPSNGSSGFFVETRAGAILLDIEDKSNLGWTAISWWSKYKDWTNDLWKDVSSVLTVGISAVNIYQAIHGFIEIKEEIMNSTINEHTKEFVIVAANGLAGFSLAISSLNLLSSLTGNTLSFEFATAASAISVGLKVLKTLIPVYMEMILWMETNDFGLH